jgi:hypothetical protein
VIVMVLRQQTAEQDEFLAIVCADEELLRAEFEAIIGACWDEPPPSRPVPPVPPAGRGRHSMAYRPPLRPRRPQHNGVRGWVRQRSPPQV